MEAVMAAINAVRSRRSEMNVPPSRKAAMILVSETPELYRQGAHFIKRLVTQEKGLPYLNIETDYSQSDKGQINTRLAAFLETIVK